MMSLTFGERKKRSISFFLIYIFGDASVDAFIEPVLKDVTFLFLLHCFLKILFIYFRERGREPKRPGKEGRKRGRDTSV